LSVEGRGMGGRGILENLYRHGSTHCGEKKRELSIMSHLPMLFGFEQGQTMGRGDEKRRKAYEEEPRANLSIAPRTLLNF